MLNADEVTPTRRVNDPELGAAPGSAEPLEVTVQDLTVVSLQPGDTVLVRLPVFEQLSQAVRSTVRRAIGAYFPGHDVLVLGAGEELAVLREVPADTCRHTAEGLSDTLVCARPADHPGDEHQTADGCRFRNMLGGVQYSNRPVAAAGPTKQRPGDQPLPTSGARCVQDRLIEEIEARRELGIRRYGSPLMTFNGRDALQDAWEEAIDLAAYLTQMVMEREAISTEGGIGTAPTPDRTASQAGA